MTIEVYARRWFDRINGNTYHSVTVFVDNEQIGHVPFAYGYDEQYMQTAFELLEAAGIVHQARYASGGSQTLRRYCSDNGITLIARVYDVYRKRDL